MERDKELERVRAEAVGQTVDEELAARFRVKEQYEVTIPREEGDIHFYVFVPEHQVPGAPAVVNMHGGGFVKGYRGRDIVFSRNIAFHTDHLVIDVDYKTAPEKKYPYALEEGYEVVRYVLAHAAEFGVDPEQVILSGESAGANLVTGIVFKSRERKDIGIARLILCYPPMDMFTDASLKPARTEAAQKMAQNSRLYNDWYVDPAQRKEICVSPIFATADDLKDFPPTIVLIGEDDVLCPEGEQFAANLISAGVTVTCKKVMGAGHGFIVRRNPGFEAAEEIFFGAVKGTG